MLLVMNRNLPEENVLTVCKTSDLVGYGGYNAAGKWIDKCNCPLGTWQCNAMGAS